MSDRSERNLARGILAGIAGGVVALWIMNEFMASIGPQLQQAVEGEKAEKPSQASNEDKPDDATMKTADAIVSTVTGGRHLSHEGKEKGGPSVHYAFRALMGAVYGAAAEEMPSVTTGFGTAFGSALFTGADLVAVHALNLSEALSAEEIPSLATPFTAHLVYGAATEAVRRLVRALL